MDLDNFPAMVWCIVPLFMFSCWKPCNSCVLFFANLTGGGALGSDFNVRSGTWAKEFAGGLRTSSAGARIRLETTTPTGHGYASALVLISIAGGKARLGGAYVDDDNYVFGEVTSSAGSSTLILWRRAGGVETQIGATAFFTMPSIGFELQICWNGTHAAASAEFLAGGVFASSPGAYAGTGAQVLLGADPGAGYVDFTSLTFEKNTIDDPACRTCSGGCGCISLYFGDMDLTVAGVTNAICTNAAAINGLWTLPWTVANQILCVWGFGPTIPSGGTCADNPILIEAYVTSTTNHLVVRIMVAGGFATDTVIYRVLIDPLDCGTLLNVSIPLDVAASGAAALAAYNWPPTVSLSSAA